MSETDSVFDWTFDVVWGNHPDAVASGQSAAGSGQGASASTSVTASASGRRAAM